MKLLLLWGCLLLPGSEDLKGPKEISRFEGDTVSVQCSYTEELKGHQKYWCRRVGIVLFRCSGTIYTGEDGQEVTQGKVSIRDSPQERTFTVTLRDLTLEDGGKYWCGIKRLGFDKTLLISLVVFPATSPHTATSPYAGSSHLATQLDSTSAKGTSPIPSSSSSKSRVSVPMVRILAPVLVLLALLLATGLAVLGSHMLRQRKEAHLAMETENQKVHLSHLTSQEEEAPSRDPKDGSPVPPHHLSGEELCFSEFIPV
ncbi:CMRF35-like molecule 9 [Orycteropus afer afer]|uniref:CMRF35-like molecule 9 n=1 Tax=Orycteropus afer afer TaxID=1230840 RepID=A0AC54Z6P7_ORYAF|nr:CMRF35-like molecule 9 [Orycteropus afer afer]